MKQTHRTSRDVILRTKTWEKALKFYGDILGLAMTHRSKTLVGFETGSFCLYVEKGKPHGPVFDFLVADLPAAKKALLASGCRLLEENPAIPRCYLIDPFGMVFNLGQAPAPATRRAKRKTGRAAKSTR